MERFSRLMGTLTDRDTEQNDLSLLDKPNNGPGPKANGESSQTPDSALRLTIVGPAANAAPPPYAAKPERAQTANANGGMAPPSSRGPTRAPGSPRKADADRARRPRGMSETSVADRDRRDRREREREHGDRPPRTESEERRRAERRKAREAKHRAAKESAPKDGKPRRTRGLDIIDQLDVTGVYGQGRKWIVAR